MRILRQMNTRCVRVAVLCFAILGCGVLSPASGANWPGWRGDGSGISTESTVPISWGPGEHIAWKTPLPGEGNSSPIVWGKQIFLTASTEGGKKRWVLCLDTTDGHMVWQTSVQVSEVAPTYPKTGYAAPTPVTDGKRVYAFFDAPGLVALDMAGNVLWTRALGPFKAVYNMGNSPVLCEGKVIICCDHSGNSFIAAYDAVTGEQCWRTPRKQDIQFSTPLIITHAGKKQIVVNAKTVVAYDPATGKELWSCRGMMDTVVPSAVYDHGMVYAVSGRNGPAMAIDPGGQGDVSETHVRMQVVSGGPYVVSPIVYPQLVLPGDDGMMRFIDAKGNIAATLHVNGHFDASPVAAANNIYWVEENGDTHVVHVAKEKIAEIAVNHLGEKGIASPAIADGRLYLRTEKHLFCIAGPGVGAGTLATTTFTGDFAALKQQYETHPAAEGDDVAVRIQVVEALGQLHDPAAIPLLKEASFKDPHWDVSEAAVKALGQYGEAAVPAFIELFNDWRPYFKVVGAQTFGRVKSVQAVPTLLKIRTDGFTPVRIASLQALAEIASAHQQQVAEILPALLAGLTDAEGVVRAAVVRGLGTMANTAGTERDAIIQRLRTCTADPNPLVVSAAMETLQTAYHIPAEVLMKDRLLYGVPRKAPLVAALHAGPIRMKFQDGELRHLYVGEKEIVRRIYFAVRDSRWDTVMPELSDVKINAAAKGFTLTYTAVCKNDIADYRWSGEIIGTPEGKITFHVSGQAGAAFQSPRVGLNILYGAESLAGQPYELIDPAGGVTHGAFPRTVIPGVLLAKNTSGLCYTTADGMGVSCTLTGGGFGLEDQRNYCDSSYKAYHSLSYPYPTVPKEVPQSDTLTLEVKDVRVSAAAAAIQVTIGAVLPGAKLPRLLPGEQSVKTETFASLNGELAKYKDAREVSWAFNPAAHMTDDDNFMENLSSVIDQVHTVRTIAPAAKIRIDPINFDSPYPRPGHDPRSQGQFAAAWSAALISELARAGVDEAVFTLTPGPAQAVLEMMAPHAGEKVLATQITASGPSPLRALALPGVLWLINITDQPRQIILEKLSASTAVHVHEPATASVHALPGTDRKLEVHNGTVTLTLAPFAVYQVLWK